MQYPEFLRRVAEQIATAHPDSDTQRAAKLATTATLETLNERLTGGEAKDLATQLPKEVQPALQTEPPVARLHISLGK